MQKLEFQIVEGLEADSTHVTVEGVLVKPVVQVFGGQNVGNQQQSVDILFVDDELGIVLLCPVEKDE